MTEPTFKKIDWNKSPSQNIDEVMTTPASNKTPYKNNFVFRTIAITCLLFLITLFVENITTRNEIFLSNVAYGEAPLDVVIEGEMTPAKDLNTQLNEDMALDVPPPLERPLLSNISTSKIGEDDSEYTVQAVLGARRQIVLASGLDSKITKFKLESGDRFKRGDVLIEYDCAVDQGRLNEALSRQRVTEQQLIAYQKLSALDSISNIELIIARENNEQNKAVIKQIQGRLKSCRHVAPWDGRVMRKMASQYEYVQRGRVLMEIASHEPLRAEFLIPSRWLSWLNVGTAVDIFIGETDNTYSAKIINVFGEVDPVSQSIQVVAEMEKYHEELLPGMSGRATFTRNTIEEGSSKGFLGLKLSDNRIK